MAAIPAPSFSARFAARLPTVSTRLDRVAYRAQQTSILLQCIAAQRLFRVATRGAAPKPDPAALEALRQRYDALLAADLANVEAGLYPRALLFQIPVGSYARQLPELARDLPRSARRAKSGDWRDIPDGVDRERFPAYFRRTFHWQTDGYFSERSARLYDVGVELLFMGTADIMRRQVIPHVVRHLRERGLGDAARGGARVLDVACGTGRLLHQLAITMPHARFSGIDLSPAYVQAARTLLDDVAEVSLAADNAEQMPYREALFDVVTSVYLFHELPRSARRNVLREMFRVVRPGGLVVIEDSAQLAESPDLAPFLGRFAVDFHEPFYEEYLRDDLADALREVGFENIRVERAFVSKVVVAHRPASR